MEFQEYKRYTGKVKFFNKKNKFGFIRVDEDGSEIYVHAKNLLDDIADEDRVEFSVKSAKRGPVAFDVKRIT